MFKPAIPRYTFIVLTGLLIFLVSCTPETQSEDDLLLIETIENSLLPSIMIEGQDEVGYHILDRMENYNVPGVSLRRLLSHSVGLTVHGFGGYTLMQKILLSDMAGPTPASAAS